MLLLCVVSCFVVGCRAFFLLLFLPVCLSLIRFVRSFVVVSVIMPFFLRSVFFLLLVMYFVCSFFRFVRFVGSFGRSFLRISFVRSFVVIVR